MSLTKIAANQNMQYPIKWWREKKIMLQRIAVLNRFLRTTESTMTLILNRSCTSQWHICVLETVLLSANCTHIKTLNTFLNFNKVWKGQSTFLLWLTVMTFVCILYTAWPPKKISLCLEIGKWISQWLDHYCSDCFFGNSSSNPNRWTV